MTVEELDNKRYSGEFVFMLGHFNHYESKYWDLFDVPERETAFEYDGHTPNEAADRL